MKSIKSLLVILVVSALVVASALMTTSIVSQRYLHTAVQSTFDAKDLTADILPPPLYLIEMRLVVSMASEGILSQDQARGEIDRLAKDFAARQEYWRANPVSAEVQSRIDIQNHLGEQFIAAARDTVAVIGLKDPAKLQQQLQQANALYLSHRTAVDATVEQANRYVNAMVTEYKAVDEGSTHIEWAVFALALLTLSLTGYGVFRSIWKSTGGEPALAATVANAVADGDLTLEVPAGKG